MVRCLQIGQMAGKEPEDETLMPVLKTFRGRPVTRLRRLDSGELQITLANAASGDRHQRTIITQEEWNEHGDSCFVVAMPNLRTLAACVSV